MINIENFDPSNIKTDEKSYKNILIYHIGSVKYRAKQKYLLREVLY